MEPRRVFLDVCFNGQEILLDELRGLLVFVGFGIQPSARFSSRSGAEVQQDRTSLLLRLGQGLIDIFAPTHRHWSSPYSAIVSP
jgi:hypothetical protein